MKRVRKSLVQVAVVAVVSVVAPVVAVVHVAHTVQVAAVPVAAAVETGINRNKHSIIDSSSAASGAAVNLTGGALTFAFYRSVSFGLAVDQGNCFGQT